MPDIYSVTPSLFLMNALRIDSPVSNHRQKYAEDCEFFDKHRSRRFRIREGAPDELELAVELGQWLQLPRQWLLITKLCDGVHQATPVYRGTKPFWTEAKTDLDVTHTLIEMAKRQGIDAAEWLAFEKKVRANNPPHAIKGSSRVH